MTSHAAAVPGRTVAEPPRPGVRPERADRKDPGCPDGVPVAGYRARALVLWPRLDRKRLCRAGEDPWRIARLVAQRTGEPPDVIVAMLAESVQALGLRPIATHETARRPAHHGSGLPARLRQLQGS